MREPTDEEREGIQAYIKSISVDTGINFFDYLIKDQEEDKECESQLQTLQKTTQEVHMS